MAPQSHPRSCLSNTVIDEKVPGDFPVARSNQSPATPFAPGHATSPDDVMETTLRREILEELGIEIETIHLLCVDARPYIEEEPGPYRLNFYYRCSPVQGFAALRAELASGKVKPVSPEIKQMRLVTLTDLAGYDLFSSDVRFLNDDLPRRINLGTSF